MKDTKFFSEIKESLKDAPKEIKQNFNSIIQYFANQDPIFELITKSDRDSKTASKHLKVSEIYGIPKKSKIWNYLFDKARGTGLNEIEGFSVYIFPYNDLAYTTKEGADHFNEALKEGKFFDSKGGKGGPRDFNCIEYYKGGFACKSDEEIKELQKDKVKFVILKSDLTESEASNLVDHHEALKEGKFFDSKGGKGGKGSTYKYYITVTGDDETNIDDGKGGSALDEYCEVSGATKGFDSEKEAKDWLAKNKAKVDDKYKNFQNVKTAISKTEI